MQCDHPPFVEEMMFGRKIMVLTALVLVSGSALASKDRDDDSTYAQNYQDFP